jgi:hypothetical protein
VPVRRFTDVTDWIEELFARIDTVDPGFRAATTGASTEDIDRWAALTGWELPADFGLHVTDTGEARVVELDGDDRPGRLLYATLPAMCFHHVFLWEQSAGGHTMTARHAPNGPAALAAVDALVARGYERQWFSPDDWCLLRTADTLITVGVGERCGWYVGGRDRAALDTGLDHVSRAAGCPIAWQPERPDKKTSLSEVRTMLG